MSSNLSKLGMRISFITISVAFLFLLFYLLFGYTQWKTQQIVPQAERMPRIVQLPDDITLELVYIPAGSFLMGSPSDEEMRSEEERQHKVTITEGYWMGKYEVTQAQWTSVMGYNPSSKKGDDFPVTDVSWYEAMQFCKSLTQREKSKGSLMADYEYLLPTESQWEYACRAGTGTSLNNGYNLTYRFFGRWPCPYLKQVGWSRNNSDRTIHPVGEKLGNAWGLYDMHGNVTEYCLDWYDKYPIMDSINPSGPKSASYGVYKILRGGSVYGQSGVERERTCRSAARKFTTPTSKGEYAGFRVVLSRTFNTN